MRWLCRCQLWPAGRGCGEGARRCRYALPVKIGSHCWIGGWAPRSLLAAVARQRWLSAPLAAQGRPSSWVRRRCALQRLPQRARTHAATRLPQVASPSGTGARLAPARWSPGTSRPTAWRLATQPRSSRRSRLGSAPQRRSTDGRSRSRAAAGTHCASRMTSRRHALQMSLHCCPWAVSSPAPRWVCRQTCCTRC